MLVSCARHTVKTTRHGCLAVPAETQNARIPSPGFSGSHNQSRWYTSETPQPNPFRDPTTPQLSHSPSSDLRVKPWSFTPDNTFRGMQLQTSSALHNLQLSHAADIGNVVFVLRRCNQMKHEGIKPDLTTYNNLLHACSRAGLGLEAWAILEDMELMGIKPDLRSFNSLINALRHAESRDVWEVVDKMTELGIAPNPQTYAFIINRYLVRENLEMALQLLREMTTLGLAPELGTAKGVIILAANSRSPRLALDLARSFEDSSVRKLDAEVWMNCLIASAQELYVDGVVQCWSMVVQQLHVLPDEGTCIDVLHTAGRHGLPELASDVMRVLKLIDAPWQEHHYAALIEAQCRAGQIKEAFLTLNAMRSEDIKPVSGTTSAIFDAISKDADILASTWSLIDVIVKEDKQPVDIAGLNVIIQAAVALGELQRAVGTYKMFVDYDVKPTVETFNLLFSGCVTASHRELGDRLLADMKEAKVKPDARTYEHVILLCLTQPKYEDAFFYLEEMKAGRYRPTEKVYETLIRKCLSVADMRYRLALEEMMRCGYRVSNELRRDIRELTAGLPRSGENY